MIKFINTFLTFLSSLILMFLLLAPISLAITFIKKYNEKMSPFTIVMLLIIAVAFSVSGILTICS